MRAYFVAQLRAVFEGSPEIDAHFHSRVGVFLDQVELFIDLLIAVRDFPETPDWKDERATATYRLMQFVRHLGRDELYIRFVHQLVGLYLESQDWLCAGLALKLNADIYEWKLDGGLIDFVKEGKIDLPAQTQFARKEALYYLIMDYYGECDHT